METKANVSNIPTREKVYNYICEFISEHHVSPSVRDIASGVGLNSTSSVALHLKRLEEDGRIAHLKGTSRSLIIVGTATPTMTGRAAPLICLLLATGNLSTTTRRGVPIAARNRTSTTMNPMTSAPSVGRKCSNNFRHGSDGSTSPPSW